MNRLDLALRQVGLNAFQMGSCDNPSRPIIVFAYPVHSHRTLQSHKITTNLCAQPYSNLCHLSKPSIFLANRIDSVAAPNVRSQRRFSAHPRLGRGELWLMSCRPSWCVDFAFSLFPGNTFRMLTTLLSSASDDPTFLHRRALCAST